MFPSVSDIISAYALGYLEMHTGSHRGRGGGGGGGGGGGEGEGEGGREGGRRGKIHVCKCLRSQLGTT